MIRALVRPLPALVLLALAACGGGGGDGPSDPVAPPPTNTPPATTPPATPPPSTSTVDTVRLVGTSFEPSTLTVRPGRTVVWINTESMLHTVTPDGHSQWTSRSSSSPGEVLRVSFGTAGTFRYFCDPHRSSGMTGSVVVQP